MMDAGVDWVWDGHGVLMHWSRPAATAAVYLCMCAAHNARLRRKRRDARSRPPATVESGSDLLSAASVAHNALLVAFSALVCVVSTHHFTAELVASGWLNMLCPPPSANKPAEPLGGRLHYWCYIFYLSKYYELVDTLLLIARDKVVIPLHALHHAFIPL